MKDFVRALESYRELAKNVKEEPFASHARFRMGECLLELGDKQAALEVFKEIKSENQDNLWARAAQSYIKTVEMEVKYGIRIIN
jgi:TolA-binding protein